MKIVKWKDGKCKMKYQIKLLKVWGCQGGGGLRGSTRYMAKRTRKCRKTHTVPSVAMMVPQGSGKIRGGLSLSGIQLHAVPSGPQS